MKDYKEKHIFDNLDGNKNEKESKAKMIFIVFLIGLIVILGFAIVFLSSKEKETNINAIIDDMEDLDRLQALIDVREKEIEKIENKMYLLGDESKSDLLEMREEKEIQKQLGDHIRDEEGEIIYTLPGNGKNHNKEANAYAYKTEEVRKQSYNNEYEGDKLAFLTFDDGPNNVITPKILDILKEEEVPATFFIVGKNVSSETGNTLRRIWNEGHAIATHSFDHNYDVLYPNRSGNAEQILKEHEMVVEAVRKEFGNDFDSKVTRYPGGHLSWNNLEESDKLLASKGIHWIDWNSMNGDAQPVNPTTPNDIARPNNTEDVINNFEHSRNLFANPNQPVVLMHDAVDKEITADTLKALIQHMKKEGYKFGILE